MASREDLIRAIDLALSGRWEDAHKLVQTHASDRRACHIHAILHLQEGDESNAGYWFRRSGAERPLHLEPETQLARLREELCG
ncbi:MAG: hypothetical protein KJ622_06120 [Alphaproteobacteria bacterium]|nr:hypothetical protein [Alphaproteobacteria bacterium]